MKKELFKKFDKYIGTPACLLLGWLKRLLRFLHIRRLGKLEEVKRILAIKLVAVGDLVALLPSLKALRELYPNAFIALMVTPRVREIVEGTPYVDEIVYYDVLKSHSGLLGFFSFVQTLRRRQFDLVVEFDQRYRITSMMGFLTGASLHAGFAVPGQGRQSLFDIKVPYDEGKHEVETFYDIIKALGHSPQHSLQEIKLIPVWHAPTDSQKVDEFFKESGISNGENLVIFHTVTSPIATERRWEPQKFAQLADYLIEQRSAKVIFTGGPDDMDYIEGILNKMKNRAFVAAGRLSLKQFAALCERAKLIVSVDTGALHIAAASGTPVLGLYGPSNPTKWRPYGKQHAYVYLNFSCSPCNLSLTGQVPSCQEPRCMKEIEVEEVIKVVDEKYSSVFKTED
jgi:ADP-heptose:LPS heptosyltransferase